MGKKTFKREYALFFVVLLAYQICVGNAEILSIIIWPFISFVAASAGLHIYDKNTTASSHADRLYGTPGSTPLNPDK